MALLPVFGTRKELEVALRELFDCEHALKRSQQDLAEAEETIKNLTKEHKGVQAKSARDTAAAQAVVRKLEAEVRVLKAGFQRLLAK